MYQYSAEQIKVPASLPEILKNYAKQVIKNQPNDIMEFSKEYFTRLAKQNSHSTKNTQLTKLQIEAFYSKFFVPGQEARLASVQEIEQGCKDSGISPDQFSDVMAVGNWTDAFPWIRFWALLLAANAGTLMATLEMAAEVIGDNGLVNVAVLKEVFAYLASQDSSVDQLAIENTNTLFQEINVREVNSSEILGKINQILNPSDSVATEVAAVNLVESQNDSIMSE